MTWPANMNAVAPEIIFLQLEITSTGGMERLRGTRV